MAEQAAAANTAAAATAATNLKRKLNDLDEPISAPADVEAPDSSEIVTAAHNNNNIDDDSSKRPRLDQLGENGHSPEEENGNAKESAEPEDDVENAEPVADVAVDGKPGDDEGAKEANTAEQSEALQLPDVEQQGDDQIDNSQEIDAQNLASGEVQLESKEKASGDETHKPASEVTEVGGLSSGGQLPDSGSKSLSRKIEIPSNKVGVLIGKSGDTIRYLQINSGAKIQITRDADADSRATTRAVELIGTAESLDKAETLIKGVIAEADAGGSPALVARGFTAALTAGSIEVEIPVPADKVGVIIGRGGETIKNLQARSGARIQLIPQGVPGEKPKDKKVKITGDKQQVEIAREMIKDVLNQSPGRPSQFSGSYYNQQNYPPRGPRGGSQWGNRGPPNQQMQYDHYQRGSYSSQNRQYPSQSYSNHPYQGPPRSNYRPQSGGYEYYGQGGAHGANAPSPRSAPPHSQGNYNYGQPRGSDYTQTAPPAQNYGHAPGGQPYGPPQQGYAPQQQYSRPPTYGMPAQGGPQPADTSYQAPVSGQTQPHQQYPQSQTQPGPGYVQPVAQPQTQPASAYAQPVAQAQPVSGYAQQGAQAQPVPGYGQQPGGYTQAAAPGAYGYQGQTDPSAYGYQGQGQADPYAAYSTAAAPAAAQAGYAQPVAAQAGYNQMAPPQTGAYPSAAAPAAQPQPQAGYPQYDASQQMYAAPH